MQASSMMTFYDEMKMDKTTFWYLVKTGVKLHPTLKPEYHTNSSTHCAPLQSMLIMND